MNEYIINQKSSRPIKIGGKAYRSALISKIRDNTDVNIILSNIERDDYKKLKKSLPILPNNKFYCYESKTKNLITKNKSIKPDQLINYICDKLPTIIDTILDEINDDDERDVIKSKMINIFHKSII